MFFTLAAHGFLRRYAGPCRLAWCCDGVAVKCGYPHRHDRYLRRHRPAAGEGAQTALADLRHIAGHLRPCGPGRRDGGLSVRGRGGGGSDGLSVRRCAGDFMDGYCLDRRCRQLVPVCHAVSVAPVARRHRIRRNRLCRRGAGRSRPDRSDGADGGDCRSGDQSGRGAADHGVTDHPRRGPPVPLCARRR